MRVPAFEAVGVLRRQLPPRTGRHADHERNAELTTRHVSDGCRVVDDLIQRQQAEIDRHHLDNRAHAAERSADAGPDEGRFRQRRIANAVGPELV